MSTRGSLYRRRVCTIALAASLLVALTACGDDDEDDGALAPDEQTAPPPTSLNVSAHEFKFDIGDSDTVEAGLTTIKLSNEGKAPHQAQLLRLNDGVELTDFEETLETGKQDEIFQLATLTGGVTTIDGGLESDEVTFNLEEGTYVLVCFFDDHNTKGMYQSFEVTSRTAPAAVPPDAEAEVSMSDFKFILPEDFDGQGTFEVINNGPQPHELQIFGVDASLAELDEFLKNPQGDPPFGVEQGGGVAALEAGTGAFAEFDLAPGVYAFACFVPDQKTGKPHFALGMYTSVEIK